MDFQQDVHLYSFLWGKRWITIAIDSGGTWYLLHRLAFSNTEKSINYNMLSVLAYNKLLHHTHVSAK